MQLNPHSIYALNAGYDEKMDKVDVYNQALKKFDSLKDAKEYINNKFGDFEGEKIFDFPELDKIIIFNLKEDFAEYIITSKGLKTSHISWQVCSLEDGSLEEIFAE